MALRKPLVIVSGQIQQLQASDTLDATTSGGEALILTNADASSAVIGTPVYIFGDDSFKKARANAAGTCKAIGLVADASIAAAGAGSVLPDGVLTATTTQWDSITGGSGGLTAGTSYFLSASVAGGLTPTAPSTVGQYVTEVGVAISSTELRVWVRGPILL